MTSPAPSRRRFVAGLATFAAAPLLAADLARAQTPGQMRGTAFGGDFGLVPDAGDADQSMSFQAAVDQTAALGVPLLLASGRYRAGNVRLPGGCTITGLWGGVEIEAIDAGSIFVADGQSDIVLENLSFRGRPAAGDADPLLAFGACRRLRLDSLRIDGAAGSGIALEQCGGRLGNLHISGCGHAAIFARLSTELTVRDCTIAGCGNGGILVWGDGEAHDGTIVTNNHISDIDWRGGGNGQNGNGINVYKANGVIVADNVIRNSAFTAIRLNATNDTLVTGNSCLNSGEVAIFSEFGFSGSVIADNIIDGAAQGISMTNFDANGRLATCTGNIVRNIYPSSAVNPDTSPAGIFAEADAVIANNIVEAVPGLGIGAGWGPYLRDVVVNGNVVRDCEIGIGVSVADGAGKAVVSANRISGARQAGIAALAWDELISSDLQQDAGRFQNISISGNSIG